MRRNNGFMSFFIFLVFLTYIFYLSYGFLKKRKEETNKIVSSINVRKEDFYKKPKPDNKNLSDTLPSTENTVQEEASSEQAVEPTTTVSETPAETLEEKVEQAKKDKKIAEERARAEKAGAEKEKADKETGNKEKSYIRVMTLNDKAKADEVLKKLGGNFKIKTTKKSDGKESYIIVSKTTESSEELKKLEKVVSSYKYQVIKLK